MTSSVLRGSYGVAYKHPTKFPIASQAPARAFYWTHERDPVFAKKLAQTLYQAYFVQDRDIFEPGNHR